MASDQPVGQADPEPIVVADRVSTRAHRQASTPTRRGAGPPGGAGAPTTPPTSDSWLGGGGGGGSGRGRFGVPDPQPPQHHAAHPGGPSQARCRRGQGGLSGQP